MASGLRVALTEGTGVRKDSIPLSTSDDFHFRRSVALLFPAGQVDLVRRLKSLTAAQSGGVSAGAPQPSSVRRQHTDWCTGSGCGRLHCRQVGEVVSAADADRRHRAGRDGVPDRAGSGAEPEARLGENFLAITGPTSWEQVKVGKSLTLGLNH